MFIHNFKYAIKTLFRNRVLIFWTFAFPIILGVFFNMAFSNIENDESFKVFDIAVVDNEDYKNNEVYKETFENLSDPNNKDQVFNIKLVSKEEADDLLEKKSIEGYVEFDKDIPKLIFKQSGIYPTILRFVVEEIEESKKILEDTVNKEVENQIKNGNYNFDVKEISNNILNRLQKEDIKLTNVSNSNLSYTVIEFYTLIAMACMYAAMLGMSAINQSLANMDKKGRRIAVSPTKKSTIVLSATLASYIVSLVGISLLMLFLLFVLKIDFGSNIGLIILLTLIGDLAGISFGVFVASVFRCSEGAKTGIIISISMFFSVLSGMMGITLKYVIDKNLPILNMINPNAMITDGFYSLYYYDTLNRFTTNIISLLIFIGVCLFISAIKLRRESYDAI